MKKFFFIALPLFLCSMTQQSSKSQYCYGIVILKDGTQDKLEDITIGTTSNSTNNGIEVYKAPIDGQNKLSKYKFNLNNIIEITVKHNEPIVHFKNVDYVNISIIKKENSNDPINCIIPQNQEIIGIKSKGIMAFHPITAIDKLVMKKCLIEKEDETENNKSEQLKD